MPPGCAARRTCWSLPTTTSTPTLPDGWPGFPTSRSARRPPRQEALLDAPEFEQIIRELCDIAGHSLLRITMGDPNYEHNGETTLAWHFTTEQGEFLMLEDDDEAFMLDPRTKEILAAVEFEEAGSSKRR